ncbi:MAG: hypothetical protein ACFFDW_11535 [Candidatus Thorarchaeota archaeon]
MQVLFWSFCSMDIMNNPFFRLLIHLIIIREGINESENIIIDNKEHREKNISSKEHYY